jgi:antirestriction protein ArdC
MQATPSLPQHSSVYQIVTEKIIRQLESGVAPWRKPWTTGAPVNLVSKREYSGLNVILLASQGYGSPYWLTFNQAKALGGHVKQGEHSSLITFWKFDKKPRVNPETNKLTRLRLRPTRCISVVATHSG